MLSWLCAGGEGELQVDRHPGEHVQQLSHGNPASPQESATLPKVGDKVWLKGEVYLQQLLITLSVIIPPSLPALSSLLSS